ncbi:hypothetical protein EX30DRAFT_239333 [Ascodesmis nigricans]|uniref:Uncharacterized protein n=1 Tax=Ascodesmis nigricans TaxID=341454 RepID=A0A4S2MYY7_9PEZI|nr:hypothetical protein EX30DRAFT_239333 [Ascodesmis nigricans]
MRPKASEIEFQKHREELIALSVKRAKKTHIPQALVAFVAPPLMGNDDYDKMDIVELGDEWPMEIGRGSDLAAEKYIGAQMEEGSEDELSANVPVFGDKKGIATPKGGIRGKNITSGNTQGAKKPGTRRLIPFGGTTAALIDSSKALTPHPRAPRSHLSHSTTRKGDDVDQLVNKAFIHDTLDQFMKRTEAALLDATEKRFEQFTNQFNAIERQQNATLDTVKLLAVLAAQRTSACIFCKQKIWGDMSSQERWNHMQEHITERLHVPKTVLDPNLEVSKEDIERLKLPLIFCDPTTKQHITVDDDYRREYLQSARTFVHNDLRRACHHCQASFDEDFEKRRELPHYQSHTACSDTHRFYCPKTERHGFEGYNDLGLNQIDLKGDTVRLPGEAKVIGMSDEDNALAAMRRAFAGIGNTPVLPLLKKKSGNCEAEKKRIKKGKDDGSTKGKAKKPEAPMKEKELQPPKTTTVEVIGALIPVTETSCSKSSPSNNADPKASGTEAQQPQTPDSSKPTNPPATANTLSKKQKLKSSVKPSQKKSKSKPASRSPTSKPSLRPKVTTPYVVEIIDQTNSATKEEDCNLYVPSENPACALLAVPAPDDSEVGDDNQGRDDDDESGDSKDGDSDSNDGDDSGGSRGGSGGSAGSAGSSGDDGGAGQGQQQGEGCSSPNLEHGDHTNNQDPHIDGDNQDPPATTYSQNGDKIYGINPEQLKYERKVLEKYKKQHRAYLKEKEKQKSQFPEAPLTLQGCDMFGHAWDLWRAPTKEGSRWATWVFFPHDGYPRDRILDPYCLPTEERYYLMTFSLEEVKQNEEVVLHWMIPCPWPVNEEGDTVHDPSVEDGKYLMNMTLLARISNNVTDGDYRTQFLENFIWFLGILEFDYQHSENWYRKSSTVGHKKWEPPTKAWKRFEYAKWWEMKNEWPRARVWIFRFIRHFRCLGFGHELAVFYSAYLLPKLCNLETGKDMVEDGGNWADLYWMVIYGDHGKYQHFNLETMKYHGFQGSRHRRDEFGWRFGTPLDSIPRVMEYYDHGRALQRRLDQYGVKPKPKESWEPFYHHFLQPGEPVHPLHYDKDQYLEQMNSMCNPVDEEVLVEWEAEKLMQQLDAPLDEKDILKTPTMPPGIFNEIFNCAPVVLMYSKATDDENENTDSILIATEREEVQPAGVSGETSFVEAVSRMDLNDQPTHTDLNGKPPYLFSLDLETVDNAQKVGYEVNFPDSSSRQVTWKPDNEIEDTHQLPVNELLESSHSDAEYIHHQATPAPETGRPPEAQHTEMMEFEQGSPGWDISYESPDYDESQSPSEGNWDQYGNSYFNSHRPRSFSSSPSATLSRSPSRSRSISPYPSPSNYPSNSPTTTVRESDCSYDSSTLPVSSDCEPESTPTPLPSPSRAGSVGFYHNIPAAASQLHITPLRSARGRSSSRVRLDQPDLSAYAKTHSLNTGIQDPAPTAGRKRHWWPDDADDEVDNTQQCHTAINDVDEEEHEKRKKRRRKMKTPSLAYGKSRTRKTQGRGQTQEASRLKNVSSMSYSAPPKTRRVWREIDEDNEEGGVRLMEEEGNYGNGDPQSGLGKVIGGVLNFLSPRKK